MVFESVQSMGSSISATALKIVVWVLLGVVVSGIIGFATWAYMNVRKYKDFKCIIWAVDGFGQITERYDNAGIFVDKKTKNKRLYLKRNNVGLDPDNIPYIPSGNKKVIYLWQTGLKNFRFIKPKICNASMSFNVGEEDVNWAINAYERQKKLFTQNSFLQYLPFIAIAFVSIIILVIFIYFFKNFDVLRDVAVALQAAANSIAQSKLGTTVM